MVAPGADEGRVLDIDFVEVERVAETATVSPQPPRQARVGRGGPGDHRKPRGAAGQGGSPNEQVPGSAQGTRRTPFLGRPSRASSDVPSSGCQGGGAAAGEPEAALLLGGEVSDLLCCST